MKAWLESLDAVRRAWAEQEGALLEAYEKMDPRQAIHIPTRQLRELADHCNRVRRRAQPSTSVEAASRHAVRC